MSDFLFSAMAAIAFFAFMASAEANCVTRCTNDGTCQTSCSDPW